MLLCRLGAHRLRMLDAAFGADGDGHLVNGGSVEGGARPMGSGNSVVPFTATPCSASLHQS